MIQFENVALFRDKKCILNEISFQIQQGESVAFMGLNGTGKSTLLKALLGLHLDYTGEITLFEKNISDPKSREGLIYLPEKFNVTPSLTGAQYLDFHLENSYHEIASFLKFPADSLHKKIKNYSKGMLQKLGLILFFNSKKKLKIADEIMSGLDYKTRENVCFLIQQQQENGTTFFFTTHLVEDAFSSADRLLYIHNETLAFDGPPNMWAMLWQNNGSA